MVLSKNSEGKEGLLLFKANSKLLKLSPANNHTETDNHVAKTFTSFVVNCAIEA